MTLFINACVRSNSRTRSLADCLLSKLGDPVTEVCLTDVQFPAADEMFIMRREQLTAAGQLDDPMFDLAHQFASADRLVIAAPYWDLSFPAVLKQYIEQINVPGITFTYTPDGIPQGLCRARELFYLSTAGGSYVPEDFGYEYVKALAQDFYGIPNVCKIILKGLDLDDADAERIMEKGMEMIRKLPDAK